jgi:hypothetical protein
MSNRERHAFQGLDHPLLHMPLALALVAAASALGCTEGPLPADPTAVEHGQPPSLDIAAPESWVVIVDTDFEDAALGALPSPFTKVTACAGSDILVTDEAAYSGAQSLKYLNTCPPPGAAFLTSLAPPACASWPTGARWSLRRRHENYAFSAFTMFPRFPQSFGPDGGTAIQFGPDGGIRVWNGEGIIMPNVVVGNYQVGVWVKVETVWDFDVGTYDVFIDDDYRGTFPTPIRQPGDVHHGGGWEVTFYDDDVYLAFEFRGERPNCA